MTRTTAGAGGWRDLVLAGGLVGLAVLALLVPGVPQPIEWALAVPFLAFLPGYALVSAIFPERPPAPETDGVVGRDSGGDGGGPQWLVRIATSLVASVLVVATVGVVLSATAGIRLVPAVFAVGLVTIGFLLIAVVRRSLQSASRRAAPLGRAPLVTRQAVGATSLQRLALAVAVLALLSTVAVASAYPATDDSYTEFYLLTENESGDLIAADFPRDVSAGDQYPAHVGVENTGDGERTYDVVVQATPDRSGGETQRLDRVNVTADSGNRTVVQPTVVPRRLSDRTRLEFLLYEDGVPSEPSAENADESLHLWIEVHSGGS